MSSKPTIERSARPASAAAAITPSAIWSVAHSTAVIRGSRASSSRRPAAPSSRALRTRSSLTTSAHGIPAASSPSRQPASRAGGHRVGRGGLALGGQRAGVAVVGGAEGDDADPAVAERREVLRGQARARAVVDADEGVRARARLVDDHERQAPLDRGREVRVVHGQRVGAEAAHDGLADGRLALAAVVRRAGRPAKPGRISIASPASSVARGEALQEQHGAGVAEGVGERLGEQQADRLAPAGAQAPGGGVRARCSRARPPWPGPARAARARAGPAGCRRWRPWCARRRGARRSSGGSPCAPRAPS